MSVRAASWPLRPSLTGLIGGSVSARVVEMFSSGIVSGRLTKTTQKQFNYYLLFDLEIPYKQTIRV